MEINRLRPVPLLLLHGALGASSEFEPLLPLLDGHFLVHRLDFEGHGSSAAPERPFRIEHFAENVRDYLQAQQIGQADVFGYSMGGYVAIYAARAWPGLVRRVATLGTKYAWGPEVAAREARRFDPEKIRARAPQLAQALQARHNALGWDVVLSRTREFVLSLGEMPPLALDDLRQVEQPVRVMLGDRDAMVSMEETLDAFHALPRGELEILPGAAHLLEQVPPLRLARALIDFFSAGD